jgi:hypothetical protein
MIIGDGDIASVLPERDDLIFFASGVSDSKETRNSEFRRELALMSRVDRNKHIVYFSSLSVFYSDTPYADHKLRMEQTIKKFFRRYTIIRLGNIDWGTNPNTLINYLRAHPDAEIQDVYRWVVDKEEFLFWINLIPTWKCDMNVVGRKLKVQEIRDEYCK